MDQRAEYLVQILEKIGAPLMASIMAQASDDDTGQASAKNMAILLTKSVQAGIDMANAAELNASGIQDDSLRVALTALASPLIARFFEHTGKIPGDTDIKKITTAMQAVLSFSENFTPEAEHTQRLSALAAQGQVMDAHQANIQYIHAVTSVINAVAAFSFGQAEQKLIMDIAGKLSAKAASLRNSLFGDMPEELKIRVDLALFRTMCLLYTACHEAETTRLMTMDEEERAHQSQASGGGLALDRVWTDLDLRVAMLEALAQNTLPGAKTAGAVQKAPARPAAAETAAPPNAGNPMAMFSKPKTEQNIPPAPPEKTPPEDNSPGKPPQGNPMSFFSKKPKSDDET